ncbi:MAG: hypothetical protein HY535_04165 [Chloroflexi bacterium]|nr:hypothetical protein [Chloroflexota bacterium]
MRNHPLGEVFGFPVNNHSPEAQRYRKRRLCPFNNVSANCTKDNAEDPLGVCSMFHEGRVVIICPIRLRQDWIVVEDAASFFFPPDVNWTSLFEVELKDRHGKAAGSVDIVLVSYDQRGRILDYGALEVQALYISGNIRRPFQHYMDDPVKRAGMDWRGSPGYPRPDYLSSSRKRLAPQLLYKGGILHTWNRKIAIALDENLYDTLPLLEEVPQEQAEMVWLTYTPAYSPRTRRYLLQRQRKVYTKFGTALDQITKPEPGDEADFLAKLQEQFDKQGENHGAPDVQPLAFEP